MKVDANHRGNVTDVNGNPFSGQLRKKKREKLLDV